MSIHNYKIHTTTATYNNKYDNDNQQEDLYSQFPGDNHPNEALNDNNCAKFSSRFPSHQNSSASRLKRHHVRPKKLESSGQNSTPPQRLKALETSHLLEEHPSLVLRLPPLLNHDGCRTLPYEPPSPVPLRVKIRLLIG